MLSVMNDFSLNSKGRVFETLIDERCLSEIDHRDEKLDGWIQEFEGRYLFRKIS